MLRKCMAVLFVVFFAGLFAGITNGEETVLQQDGEHLVPTVFPNPDDTIIYDSPPPIASFPLPYGPYWAVRFTPADVCTVLAGLASLELLSGSPVCTLYVWDDSAGVPGSLVGGTPVPFTPTGYPNYDRVDLPAPYEDADDFWIGFLAYSKVPDEANALTDSITNFTRGWVSMDGKIWNPFGGVDPPIPGDLLLRAIVEYPAANPDVAVDSILAPPDTVPCLTPAPVSARVCNVGDTTVTFDVEALIPGLYGDTVTAVTLSPAACSTLTFANWDVPDSHGVCFDVRFHTLLAIDINPLNDTMSAVSCAFCPANPDVAVDSILAPPDTVPCLTPAPVSARVCNVGDTTVTFDVEALVPGLYGDTVTPVTLSPAACSVLTFVNWDVPDSHGVCFDVRFHTLLAIDIEPSNDTMTTVSCADCPPAFHDVGVISIDSPPDTVYADSLVAVAATVVNFGDSTEASFFVSATIDGYSDATMVTSIAPGETLQVTFDSWMVPSPCDTTYTATIISLLGVDQNPANDTLTKETYARCPEGISQEPMSSIPRRFALLHSRPNPFSTSTEIRYQLPVETHVSIDIYDPCGRLVRSLLDKVEAPGFKQVVWNGQADDGNALNSGIYFCKLHVRKASAIGEFTQTRKLILLR